MSLQTRNMVYDVVIVGGGIYGVCTAWDAVLRGLSVALLEKDQIGQGNSANSLKFIHGGLRYLQSGNIRLARKMARERDIWQHIAPDLVRPMPVILPLNYSLTLNPITMKIALWLNDLVAFDSDLPHGRLLSAKAMRGALPHLTQPTWGAMWHDVQMVDSERLTRAFAHSALSVASSIPDQAAVVMEGVEMIGRTQTTIHAYDHARGQSLDVEGKLVINCTGPHLVAQHDQPFQLSLAINLVVPKLWETYAAGLKSANGQMLFFAPWQDSMLIGTYHAPWYDAPDGTHPCIDTHVSAFIAQINTVDGVQITAEDVKQVHRGFLPVHPNWTDRNKLKLVRESLIESPDRSILNLFGVKYTTARWTAEKAIDWACEQLQRPVKSRTATTPLNRKQD